MGSVFTSIMPRCSLFWKVITIIATPNMSAHNLTSQSSGSSRNWDKEKQAHNTCYSNTRWDEWDQSETQVSVITPHTADSTKGETDS